MHAQYVPTEEDEMIRHYNRFLVSLSLVVDGPGGISEWRAKISEETASG